MTGACCATGHVARLELELERAIRQLAEAVVEELVDRPGEDHLAMRDHVAHFAVVGVEQDLDVRMRQHALEHPRVAVQRHRLVGVGEVAIVAVGAHRHARGHRGVELRRIEAPLLARVVAEELLVQLAADLADDDVFGGADLRARLGDRSEELLELERREVRAVQLVDRVRG